MLSENASNIEPMGLLKVEFCIGDAGKGFVYVCRKKTAQCLLIRLNELDSNSWSHEFCEVL